MISTHQKVYHQRQLSHVFIGQQGLSVVLYFVTRILISA